MTIALNDKLKRYGIIKPSDILYTSLKTEALYFDSFITTRMAYHTTLALAELRSLGKGVHYGREKEELDFLREKAILLEADKMVGRELGIEFLGEVDEAKEWMDRTTHPDRDARSSTDMPLTEEESEKMMKGYNRKIAQLLLEKGFRAVPIYGDEQAFNNDFPVDTTTCVSVVIDALPVLNHDVPWRQILEFRDDDDSKRKLRALRNWQNSTIHEKLSPSQMADKLAHLLDEYTQHIELHKLKHDTGRAELIFTSIASTIEGLVKLKLSDAVKTMFSFKKRGLNLREAELSAPGREIAFIHKATTHFGKDKK